jgi:polyisoprenyl-phosphate glycosyltransferase
MHIEVSMDKIYLSTVTPVYSGAPYLKELVAELEKLKVFLDQHGDRLVLGEALFVSDDARDESVSILEGISETYPWLRVITLSRNYGQHAATVAGILHSSGDWVVTLDEDGQHPPQDILRLLEQAVAEQLDVVYAAPEKGPHGTLWRDLPSRLCKRLVGTLSGNQHAVHFNSFRLARGSILRAAAAVFTHSSYFDVVLGWFTTRVGCVSLPLHDPRADKGQQSGYSLGRLIRHAKRLLVSSDIKILRAGSFIGLVALAISALFAAYTLYAKLLQPELVPIQGWTSTILAVLFLGGVSCLLLGICLELLFVVLRHVQGKPTFLVTDRSRDTELVELFQKWRADGLL